jgi:hypothetical protein
MPVLLSISVTDLDEESIQDLAVVKGVTGIEASLGERPAGSGTKGE